MNETQHRICKSELERSGQEGSLLRTPLRKLLSCTTVQVSL